MLQLEKVSPLLPADLARRTPLLPGKETVAFPDIDSMQKRVYGHAKQGAAFGHTKIGHYVTVSPPVLLGAREHLKWTSPVPACDVQPARRAAQR